jgi:hypothetical protein
MRTTQRLSQGSVLALLFVSIPTQAAWQNNPPGLSEIINCINSPTAFSAIHWSNNWSTPTWTSFQSASLGGNPYWNYATQGDNDICHNWVNGSIAGGATYAPPAASVRRGITQNVSTYWYDFSWPNFYDQKQCGHQHLIEYVWGWRYLGNGAWTVEYVTMTAMSTGWNSTTKHCDFKGTGAPGYSSLPEFAFGNGVVSIPNSPYAVLYVKSQAQSHAGGPCGAFGCFHPLLVIAWN